MRFISILLFVSYLFAETSPLNEVKETLNQVLAVVAEKPGDENKDLRRQELRKVLEPRFDFDEMAKRSLGANWKDRTESEQKEFVSVFSELLARTYVARIENVKPGMVQFENESVELPKALVKTTVKSEGSMFPIDYRLLLKDNQWKVYDVAIENIGLVANYRNEFSAIIRREEFSGLMKSLREKVEKK